MTALNPAILGRFGEVRFLAQERGEVSIDHWNVVDPRQIGRRFESRENRIGDLAAWNFLLAVAVRDVARPEAHVLAVGMIRRPEKNDGVAAFAPADVIVPENFHEIARLRLREIGEVVAEAELVKQTRSSGSVRIPATPNTFAILLIANDELIQRREIELAVRQATGNSDACAGNNVSAILMDFLERSDSRPIRSISCSMEKRRDGRR